MRLLGNQQVQIVVFIFYCLESYGTYAFFYSVLISFDEKNVVKNVFNITKIGPPPYTKSPTFSKREIISDIFKIIKKNSDVKKTTNIFLTS